ncbi:hypothetical protein ARMSODRAFT_1024677 [Armillaria solidipes]|uniref:F-box domain-containing protein n=1 Tax=Armillaria solidipes TaxID=1076256 RepID=A0A2H3AVF4_9AGAR|nr:hypothetical protein ARMSODRAFT_1024677 [Armillaria solidipes]
MSNARDTPYIISQVCADWHDIILDACLDIWADMKVIMGHGVGGLGLKAWDSLVLAAMEHSGSHSLDIEFHGVEEDPSNWASIHCFQYLLGEGYRWRTATLKISPQHLPFLNHLSDYCPWIESSLVALCTSDMLGTTNIAAFSMAASLKQLAFTGLRTNADLKFPIHNITCSLDIRLRVQSDIHDNVIWRLASVSSLKSLELLYTDIFVHSNLIPHPMVFSSVSYFHATNLHTLNWVSIPNLETLVIEPAHVCSSNIHETKLHVNTLSAVCNMVQCSGCYMSLRTLKMYNVPLHSISNLVHLIPWMKVISLGFTCWTGKYDGMLDLLLVDLTASTVGVRGIRRLRWMQDLSSLLLTIDTPSPRSTWFLSESLVGLMEAHVPADIGLPFEFNIKFKYSAGQTPETSKDFQDQLDFCQRLGSSCKLIFH